MALGGYPPKCRRTRNVQLAFKLVAGALQSKISEVLAQELLVYPMLCAEHGFKELCFQITKLDISSSYLEELPNYLKLFTNLKLLNICQNCLRTLPDWLGTLIHLEGLFFSGNIITTIPQKILELPKLKYLHLDSNPIAFSIIKQIKNKAEFKSIMISANHYRQHNEMKEWAAKHMPECVLSTGLEEDFNWFTVSPNISDMITKNNVTKNAALAISNTVFIMNSGLPLYYEGSVNVYQKDVINVLRAKLDRLHAYVYYLLITRSERKNNLAFELLAAWQAETQPLPKLIDCEIIRFPLKCAQWDIKKEYVQSLRTLDLENKGLTEVPTYIGKFTGLVCLLLTSNRLSKLPKEVGNLSQLRDLYMSNNQFNEIPEIIFSLTNLETLHLSKNPIKSIPTKLNKLIGLRNINLVGAELSETNIMLFKKRMDRINPTLQIRHSYSFKVSFSVTDTFATFQDAVKSTKEIGKLLENLRKASLSTSKSSEIIRFKPPKELKVEVKNNADYLEIPVLERPPFRIGEVLLKK